MPKVNRELTESEQKENELKNQKLTTCGEIQFYRSEKLFLVPAIHMAHLTWSPMSGQLRQQHQTVTDQVSFCNSKNFKLKR